MVNDLPQDPAELDSLAQQIYDIGLEREARDMARLEKVIAIATGSSCESS